MSHLTRKQRYTIVSMLQNGYKQKEIALVINKDKSVVSTLPHQSFRVAKTLNQHYSL
ncbi:MAG: hypothetical protein BWZ11_00654 [Bacteroidetes bacterium ADurb.BinA395]|nr:MAG: hypothetical protein BWZ11_00654 [Bacteroidetes bacterium ADurb.BinA395]